MLLPRRMNPQAGLHLAIGIVRRAKLLNLIRLRELQIKKDGYPKRTSRKEPSYMKNLVRY